MLNTLTLRRTLRSPARPLRVEGAALDVLDDWQPALLAAVVATCVVSVVVAEIFIALAFATFVARLAVGRAALRPMALNAPILAFGVWTVLSACFADDPVAAHHAAKKLVLFAVLWVAVDSLADAVHRERVVDAALLGGLALGAGCLAQYYFLGYDTLNNRPRGFLGHYMTSAGLGMSMLVLAIARLVFRGRSLSRPSRWDWLCVGGLALMLALALALGVLGVLGPKAQRGVVALTLAAGALALVRGGWPGPGTSTLLTSLAVPVAAWSLLISQTRSAWLGTMAGLALVLLLWAPRALVLLPAGAVLALAIGPRQVLDRLTVTDESSVDRYYMWQAGIDIVSDRPIFGVGPGQVQSSYSRYRWAGAPNVEAPHLHDNAIQLAAERGLPGVVIWMWLVVVAMREALKEVRRGARGSRWLAVGTLAVWTAVMAAGLFEYNFGDSEIRILLLVVTAAPYALRRAEEDAGRPAPA